MGTDTPSETIVDKKTEQVEQTTERAEQIRSPQSETQQTHSSRRDHAVKLSGHDEQDDSSDDTGSGGVGTDNPEGGATHTDKQRAGDHESGSDVTEAVGETKRSGPADTGTEPNTSDPRLNVNTPTNGQVETRSEERNRLEQSADTETSSASESGSESAGEQPRTAASPEQHFETTMEGLGEAEEEDERKSSFRQAFEGSLDAGEFFGDMAAGAESIEMKDRHDGRNQHDAVNPVREERDAAGANEVADTRSLCEMIDPDSTHEADELFFAEQRASPESPDQPVSEAVDTGTGLLLAAAVCYSEVVRRWREG